MRVEEKEPGSITKYTSVISAVPQRKIADDYHAAGIRIVPERKYMEPQSR